MKERVGSPSSEMDQSCPELQVRGARLVAGTTRTSERRSISRGREWGGKAGAERKEHCVSRLRSLGSVLEAVRSHERCEELLDCTGPLCTQYKKMGRGPDPSGSAGKQGWAGERLTTRGDGPWLQQDRP